MGIIDRFLGSRLRVLRQGRAMRVVFFYSGEEGTYLDHVDVTLFENGIVHLRTPQEDATTHLRNCEILWNYDEGEEKAPKIRLLHPGGRKGRKDSDGTTIADDHELET